MCNIEISGWFHALLITRWHDVQLRGWFIEGPFLERQIRDGSFEPCWVASPGASHQCSRVGRFESLGGKCERRDWIVTGSDIFFQGYEGLLHFFLLKGFIVCQVLQVRETWFLDSYPEICQVMDPLEMDDWILDLIWYSWSQDAPISTVAISRHGTMLTEQFTKFWVPVGWISTTRVSGDGNWGDVPDF